MSLYPPAYCFEVYDTVTRGKPADPERVKNLRDAVKREHWEVSDSSHDGCVAIDTRRGVGADTLHYEFATVVVQTEDEPISDYSIARAQLLASAPELARTVDALNAANTDLLNQLAEVRLELAVTRKQLNDSNGALLEAQNSRAFAELQLSNSVQFSSPSHDVGALLNKLVEQTQLAERRGVVLERARKTFEVLGGRALTSTDFAE